MKFGMSKLSRCLAVFVSIGWIAPLTFAFWAEHGFLIDIVWASITSGTLVGGSFHPVDYAPRFFYLSMAWLAGVIAWWVWRLTDTNDPR